MKQRIRKALAVVLSIAMAMTMGFPVYGEEIGSQPEQGIVTGPAQPEEGESIPEAAEETPAAEPGDEAPEEGEVPSAPENPTDAPEGTPPSGDADSDGGEAPELPDDTPSGAASPEDAPDNTENTDNTGNPENPASPTAPAEPCPHERGEGCPLCAIEGKIAELPEAVTEENAQAAAAQLDEISAVYGELSDEDAALVDLSRCAELAEQLAALEALEGLENSVGGGTPSLLADGSIPYLDADQSEQIHEGAYTPVAADTTKWNAGWYVAEGNVTIGNYIQVSGDVHLILKDGCTLTTAPRRCHKPFSAFL